MSLAKASTLIYNCFMECYEIADKIAEAGYWSDDETNGDEEIALDVIKTQRKLISHLMVADDYLRAEEADLYRLIYNTPEESNDKIKNQLLHYVDVFPDFFSEVPAYLEAIMEFDENNSTDYTSIIINNLENIGIHIISCDDDVSPLEVDALSSYIHFLRRMAAQAGLEVLPNVDQRERYLPLQKQDEVSTDKDIEPYINTLMGSLNRLVGLDKVKSDVTSLTNLIKVRELRRQQNMLVPPISMHLVFTGNPGTGKTTVARLLSQIYRSLGVLSTGQLVETDRSGLVAGYLGQTAIKVQSIVKQAVGGILFIDEAYSLTSSERGGDEYGQEAISTLLKLMEDNRDNLVIIAAGYPDKMEDFLNSNPGLRSRFNKFIHFEDYSSEELYIIFERMYEDNGYALNSNADHLAHCLMDTAYAMGNTKNGNGRAVRNFFEATISNHADRVAAKMSVNIDDLSVIKVQDLPNRFS